MKATAIVNTTHPGGSEGEFAHAAGAQLYLDEVIAVSDPSGYTDGLYQLREIDVPDEVLTISLSIENTYEWYADVTTRVVDAVIPIPPPESDVEAYDLWCEDHIRTWTGIGQVRGDSWYDVTVTSCTEPDLIGTEFTFGY